MTPLVMCLFLKQAQPVRKERKVTQVALVWTCQGLRERRGLLASQECQVKKGYRGDLVSPDEMASLGSKVRFMTGENDTHKISFHSRVDQD